MRSSTLKFLVAGYRAQLHARSILTGWRERVGGTQLLPAVAKPATPSASTS